MEAMAEKQIIKEGLSEYFIYSIEGAETIPNGWSKRLPSFKATEVPITSYYKFEKERWGEAVMRYYRFTNSEPSKLGKEPLPDGEVKAFRVVTDDNLVETYTVQAGDTLGKIAVRYGTTVAALLQLNGLSNPDVLAIGQKLKVPGTGGGAPAAVGTPKPATGGQGRTYIVQKGDTLLSIARRYGLTTKQLQAANNITNPDKIFPGQKLVIP